ncbi:hypothetical protein DFO68_11816 [Halomonas ventosae]|uniref:Uncharacterized protein n=1 Tax=Halomonas ventosae TaxID=229007 RepID=A0A4V3BYJ9_9GAMM|nr:hypothetical protein DFO68_11816 [Halomonas ventosae]
MLTRPIPSAWNAWFVHFYTVIFFCHNHKTHTKPNIRKKIDITKRQEVGSVIDSLARGKPRGFH